MSDMSINNSDAYKGFLPTHANVDDTSNNSEKSDIDPNKHPIAAWEANNWGWSDSDALKSEKQFDKIFEKECMEILNKYKHQMKQLDPNATNNQ